MARYTDSRLTVGSLPAINNELEKIGNTQADHLSRKPGDTPNAMETDLDMNSFKVINLPAPTSPHEPLRQADIDLAESQVQNYVDQGVSDIDTAIFNAEGTLNTAVNEATAQASKAEAEADDAEQSANTALVAAASASRGGKINTLDFIKQLAAIENPADGEKFQITSFWPGLNLGGVLFVWNSTRLKADHNGGTIIDPDKFIHLGLPTDADPFGPNNEYFQVSSGTETGCFEIINNGSNVRASWYGAIGDRSFDCTASIQAALNTLGKPDDASTVFVDDGAGVVYIDGINRITSTLYQPSWVIIAGNYPGAISRSFQPERTLGSVIFADFENEESTAISACGIFRSTGNQINLITDVINTDIYDGGHITRRYGVGLKDIVIATSGDVKIGWSVAGAPSFTIDNVTIFGFLNGVAAHSSWGVHVNNLNIRAKHVCWMGYNIKASNISGYWSGTGFGPNTPPLDATSAIAGFQSESPNHNPASIRYLTTCIYERFSSSNTYRLTLESMERGIAGFNVFASHFTGAYIESISELPLHSVACEYTFDAPRIFQPSTSFVRASSSGSVQINLPVSNIVKWDYGSQTTFGASAQVRIVLNNQQSVPESELRSPAINFEFIRTDPLKIYVSSNGSNGKTGLRQSAPLLTVDEAIDSAKFYGAKIINVADNETVIYSTDKSIEDNMEFRGLDSTITCSADRVINLFQADIKVSGLTIAKSSLGSSSSFRGIFRIREGNSRVSFRNTTLSGPVGEAVFIPEGGNASTLSVSWGAGTVITNIAKSNNAFSTSDVAVVEAIAPNSTLGASAWSSNYRVLS